MIREFDLDAPKESRTVRFQFRRETRCVTALMEHCYSRSKDTGKPWKILVEVVTKISDPAVRDLLGVLTIQVKGNVSDFFQAGDKKKRIVALRYLMRGIKKVVKELDWSMEPFRVAEHEVISLRHVNEWTWKKPKFNKSRTLTAEIFVQHEPREIRISAVFRDKNKNVLSTQHLVSDEPSEFIFSKYFGRFGWTDNESIELVSRDGSECFSASC